MATSAAAATDLPHGGTLYRPSATSPPRSTVAMALSNEELVHASAAGGKRQFLICFAGRSHGLGGRDNVLGPNEPVAVDPVGMFHWCAG